MTDRLPVTKTHKLYIAGTFPRTESGRSIAVKNASGEVLAHVCQGSRKDLRNAVEVAQKVQPKWAGATAYLRGQILYRIAEMMEGRASELAEALTATGANNAQAEVAAAIDLTIAYAGWADKWQQVLGTNNAVAGPYYNFTVPEPTGVAVVVAPDEPGLLGLIALLLPIVCAGDAAVCIASETHPLIVAPLAECLATSDLPGGVVNLITGFRDELVEHIATHRDIDAVHAAGLSAEHASTLRAGSAENLKRVTLHDAVALDTAADPWWIEPFVEMKTVWHPSAV